MPNEPTSALLPVIQADRELAAAFYANKRNSDEATHANILNGFADHHEYVQRVARHRIDHSPTPTDPEVAALMERLREAEATVARIRAALEYVPPRDQAELDRAIAADRGLSIRALAKKHGVSIGVVRGSLTRLSAKLQPSDMGASLRDRAGHEPSPASGLGHPVTIASAATCDSNDYHHPFYGILNAQGQLWTPVFFANQADASEYLDRFIAGNPGQFSRMVLTHKIVPVRVQLTAQGTEAGTAETERLSPKGDGPVAESHAPNPSHKDNPHER